MKKLALIFGCMMMLWATTAVKAENIDEQKARNVAMTYVAALRGEQLHDFNNTTLVKVYKNPAADLNALYVFNVGDAFIVVSGSMCTRPVLSYSLLGSTSEENIASNPYFESWLQSQADMISEAQMENIPADAQYRGEWEKYMNFEIPRNYARKSTNTKNLIGTTWSQSAPYNAKCPIYSGGARSVVGCVALAMGMVIRYWEYPTFGSGISYPNSVSGVTYTVDFSRAASLRHGTEYEASASGYNYSLMPNNLQSNSPEDQRNATALFLFHCGMAVRSQYSANATGSSLEYVGEALHDHFKYPSMKEDNYGFYQVERRSMSNDAWVELLRKEMLAGRPVIYRAADNGNSGEHSGHAFVIDGYKPENGMFHVNWGWGGTGAAAPMFCDMNEIDGLSTTLGSTTYLYSSGQGAIINILPPADSIHISLPVSKGIDDMAEVAAIDAVYPSPATEYVNIPYHTEGTVKQMDIYNAKGVLMTSVALNEQSGVQRLNVMGYPAGIYTCRMGGASRSFIVK